MDFITKLYLAMFSGMDTMDTVILQFFLRYRLQYWPHLALQMIPEGHIWAAVCVWGRTRVQERDLAQKRV